MKPHILMCNNNVSFERGKPKKEMNWKNNREKQHTPIHEKQIAIYFLPQNNVFVLFLFVYTHL